VGPGRQKSLPRFSGSRATTTAANGELQAAAGELMGVTTEADALGRAEVNAG